MIYELFTNSGTVGFFPTEADARHHADYMPQGHYILREWIDDGDFLLYDRETCRTMDIEPNNTTEQ